ncbi:ATP-dependent DNA helicase PIF1 [Hirsutella rhossiliensis]|uniref:ATP-dependent DNA helicase PIF1 n=1 Tax=Hirsutella rhossiliensis TaxID=111463 RepID=A0A9P8N1U7_9HYPO|nr:ATP-dependent DNA helicase PIF1 [Hirsutella rhossiliensis]KAH0964364.1 ATP-dependent DNA helicase PIF1 [Hirsutella rhossiliensis]
MEGDPRFQQQFARDFRVRRSCLLTWLHYLRRHHPGYRDIVVSRDRLQRLPLDGSIVDSVASQVADIPGGEVTDTELNALQSRFLNLAPDSERMADVEHMPPSAQAQHRMPLPSVRRTPIDEFNRSQPLLTLAFPTLYPDGKADFVEPRLRSITYQDYLGHAMRWHDGRFARHKTWPFVALNTLLRAQVRKRSGYFVKQRDGRHQALTRADLEEAMAKPDEPEAQALIQSITRQAAVIRGTRPYCAADYHWESLYRHMPRFNEWQAAPEAARMALTIVLKQKFNLTDFWGRYEWQGRGSSHHHGLYWLNGHPDLDPDDDQSRERFARIWGYHVSAVNPEPQRIQAPGEGNPLIINLLQQPLTVQFLSMVVNRVQRHRCNNYCMQLNKHTKRVECRFGFPHDQRLLASLDKAPHSKHWSFRGERNDGQINHYNRLLTVSWLANTDVSPCTSLQQVIDYAAKYCSKSEKKSESFAQIGKALMPRVKDHNPLVSFTSKLLNQLVAERDYSKQEVSHLLLGLPLQEGSRTCLYVDCRHPDRHSRSLRIDGGEVDEAPNVYEKLIQKDNSGQITAVLSPIVGSTTVMVMTITAGQKRLDYSLKRINTRLCLWRKNLMTKTGFASPLFYLTTPLPRKVSTYLAAAISTSITTGHGMRKILLKSFFTLMVVVVQPPYRILVLFAVLRQQALRAFPQRNLEFFGGVSVLLVGDFFQLPPVRQKPLYSTSTGLSSLERRGQVAYRLFDRTVFLTTAQRQAGDDQAQFRQALQELREVKLSIPSWNLLSNRVQAKLTQSEVDSFGAALRVYSTKARVEAKNQGKGAGQAPSDNAGNLSNKFPVAKGARVMLTTNLWQPAGLVNGAQDPPAVIMVDFDGYDGPPYLTTNEGRKISPILPSLTKDQIVTDLATRDFQAGISYVAVSRVTSLQGLLLEAPFDRQSLYKYTPTEGMKMRLADQQRRQTQQLTNPPYTPLYLD